MDCEECNANHVKVICVKCDKYYCQECAAGHELHDHNCINIKYHIQGLIENKNKKLVKYSSDKKELKTVLKKIKQEINDLEAKERDEEMNKKLQEKKAKKKEINSCHKKMNNAFEELKKYKEMSIEEIENPKELSEHIKKIKTKFKVPEISKSELSGSGCNVGFLVEDESKSQVDSTTEEKHKELVKENEKNKEEIGRLTAEKNELEESIKQLKEEIAKLKEDKEVESNDEQNKALEGLNEQIAEKEKEYSMIRENINTETVKLDNLKEEVEKKNKELSEANEKLKENENFCKELAEKKDELEKEIEELVKKRKDSGKSSGVMKSDNDEFRVMNSDVKMIESDKESPLKTISEDIKKLQKDKEDLEEEIADSNNELAKLKNSLEEAKSNLEESDAKLNESEKTRNELEDEIKRMKQDLKLEMDKKKEKEMKKIEDEIAKINKEKYEEFKLKAETFNSIIQSVVDLEGRKANLDKEITELEIRKNDSAQYIKNLKDINESAKYSMLNIEDNKKTIEEQEDQIVKLREVIVNTRKAIKRFKKAHIDTLRVILSNMRHKIELALRDNNMFMREAVKMLPSIHSKIQDKLLADQNSKSKLVADSIESLKETMQNYELIINDLKDEIRNKNPVVDVKNSLNLEAIINKNVALKIILKQIIEKSNQFISESRREMSKIKKACSKGKKHLEDFIKEKINAYKEEERSKIESIIKSTKKNSLMLYKKSILFTPDSKLIQIKNNSKALV